MTHLVTNSYKEGLMKSNHNVEHISMLTPDTIKESVMKRHEELSSILSNIHSRISHAPDGSLRTAQKANGCQYYHKVKVGDTKGRYIKKNNYNLAIKLAQKDYDLKVETCLIKELDFLQRILDQYRPDKIQHIYDSLNNSRKQIVTPVYVSDEEFIADWKSLEYTSLGFSPDYAEYYTDNGERVRSKSEIIIANKLYRYNIPYRYECPLQLQSGVITHPDFTCLNVSTRQEYIWEHFGIMDNAEYACNAIRKINDYANSGYILGKNFIATFETSNTPINANYIDDIIRTNISCL